MAKNRGSPGIINEDGQSLATVKKNTANCDTVHHFLEGKTDIKAAPQVTPSSSSTCSEVDEDQNIYQAGIVSLNFLR